MKPTDRKRFITMWKKYFNDAELPITFYYTDEEGRAEPVKPGSVHHCVIAALQKVRAGKSLCFDAKSIGCPGGKRYLGFAGKFRPNFAYFLSCGIPGKLEGERYKQTPQLVNQAMEYLPEFKAPGRYIIFKRWDMLEKADEPQVVIFFAVPDVLAGLFTLANFDEARPDGVLALFGSGCSSIVYSPYLQSKSRRPRSVMGMFDPSARPFVPPDVITFATPMNKFARMVDNMEESFLITDTWKKVQKRIK